MAYWLLSCWAFPRSSLFSACWKSVLHLTIGGHTHSRSLGGYGALELGRLGDALALFALLVLLGYLAGVLGVGVGHALLLAGRLVLALGFLARIGLDLLVWSVQEPLQSTNLVTLVWRCLSIPLALLLALVLALRRLLGLLLCRRRLLLLGLGVLLGVLGVVLSVAVAAQVLVDDEVEADAGCSNSRNYPVNAVSESSYRRSQGKCM